jgi:tetratricopeptide (TPR) repeat protein
MLLATVVLSAALAPQAPAEDPLPPVPPPSEAPATPEAAPLPASEEPLPPLATEPAPALAAEPTPATGPASTPSSAIQEHIDAGLKAFIRGRFSQAQGEFEKAYNLDSQSAAAAFYLGYACYKLGEPSRRMDPDKTRAKELFAQAYTLDPAFVPVWNTKKE